MSRDFTRRAALCGLAGVSFAACGQIGVATAPGIPETTGFANVPGGRVWWMRVGNGPKTPLLLLHGGPGAGHNYLLSMKALADERPVIFYDQLGCGRSDSPDDVTHYTFARAVDEVDAVREALGLERLILFGSSWGAMLAIEYFATGRGTGVEKLILSGGYASTPQVMVGIKRLLDDLPNEGAARLTALEAAGQQQSDEYQQLVQLFYERHLCRARPWPPDVLASVDNITKSPAYRIMWGPNEFTVVGSLKDWEWRGDLGAIRVPTLITTGQYDEVTLDCHRTILESVAESQLLLFEGCSHMTMVEKPVEYARALRGFMA